MDPFLAPNTPRSVTLVSYMLIAVMIAGTLSLHLLPAAISGLLVYSITRSIEQRLLARRSLSNWARLLSVSVVILLACAVVAGVGIGIGIFIHKNHGFSGLLLKAADVIADLRNSLPESAQAYIPDGVEEVRNRAGELLKRHGQQVSTIGYGGLKAAVLALIGMIVGAMISLSDPLEPARYRPLSGALLERLCNLTNSFRTVIFAQIRISALNTTLTAIYLVCVLPLLGYQLPFAKTLVILTFVVGLLPVIGNLISNTFIVLVSISVSLEVAIASMTFLVVIHKLEYFVNAKIIGHRIDAKAWELIIAMTVMETVFGIGGVIAAPVLYAYLKKELDLSGLIGVKRAQTTAKALSKGKK